MSKSRRVVAHNCRFISITTINSSSRLANSKLQANYSPFNIFIMAFNCSLCILSLSACAYARPMCNRPHSGYWRLGAPFVGSPTDRLIAWPHSITISGQHYYFIQCERVLCRPQSVNLMLNATSDLCSEPSQSWREYTVRHGAVIFTFFGEINVTVNLLRDWRFSLALIFFFFYLYASCRVPVHFNFMRKNVWSDKRPSSLTFKQNKLNEQHFFCFAIPMIWRNKRTAQLRHSFFKTLFRERNGAK